MAAGASFETRESRNSFNYVELDIGQGTCTIVPFEYLPKSGEFVETAPQAIAMAFRHVPKPNAADLVAAILHVAPGLSAIAGYLACLLRGDKSEFLAFDDGRAVFLSLDALEEDGASCLKVTTRSFMSLRNLCAFAEAQTGLRETLATFRNRLCDYGEQLLALADGNSAVREALANRDRETKAYVPAEEATGARYTLATLRDLRESRDFATLKRFASRSADDPNPDVRREALRGLALVDARSLIKEEREQAVSLLSELCDSPQCEADDFVFLIHLLVDSNQMTEAKERIRAAIKKFPEKSDGFSELGMNLVQRTGDRAFRDELLQRQEARGAQ
jgi:hypothetical protein